MPGNHFGGNRAFTQVRHLEYVAAHDSPMAARNASATRACPGKYSHSNACGYGVSHPATRWIGASRYQKHSSWMLAESSAPKPEKRVASCATTQRPVFLTEEQMGSMSSGDIVRTSMISASSP